MCGIAGVVSFAGPPDRARVARMVRALRHRGPDGEGVAELGDACLGHTRLALLDREGSAQPMTSADGRFALTYNGQLYEHAALRAELADRWPFRTRGDAEVVLAALATWGEAALERFEGMFALFFWDRRERRGLLARDRLGVKPAVFAETPFGFAFASEAKALVAAMDGAPRANADAILEVLVAPCFSGVDTTPFEGVQRLPAGGLLRVGPRGPEAPERWWTPRFDPDPHAPHAERIRAALGPAVLRTMRADVPVGAFLSGGLDSTVICAFAARRAQEEGDPLRTWTVRYQEQARFDYARSAIVVSDDLPFASLAARELSVRHAWVDVPRARFADDLRALATVNDLLPAWEQELSQRHLALAASRDVKAVLVGDAADETHWGYHFLLDDDAVRSPETILRRLGSAPVRRDRLERPVDAFAARYVALAEQAGHRWDDDGSARLATAWLVIERWLGRLLHNGDVHAMHASLEARVPFADADLLRAALAVPPEHALAGGVEKRILREATRGLVPEPIRARRKSALPKDQGTGELLRAEARAALERARPFLVEYIDMDVTRALAAPGPPLAEPDRATLFRIASLAHWSEAYGVRP